MGEEITVDFPDAVVPHDRSGPYVVVDVDWRDTLTARPMVGDPPDVRVGTPCLIHPTIAAAGPIREASILSAGPGGIVVGVHVADQSPLPHCRRPMAAFVEVPGTEFGVITGVTEDVSLAEVCVRVPVALPAGRRAFISIHGAESTPILAIARIVACGPILDEGIYFLRAEFTLVSPLDQLRLFSVMDWSGPQPRVRVEGQNPSMRHLIRLVWRAGSDPRHQ